eukprot:tig00020629_g12479.t1
MDRLEVVSLSTFSGHVRRIRRILARAGPSSLVLLDEVGGGTDPQEGAALGIALLRALAGRAAVTLATTHFGELKTLKYQDARFENASVEFDDATLGPTYRLLWGIPGRSNALAIAERLGMEEQKGGRAAQRARLSVEEIAAKYTPERLASGELEASEVRRLYVPRVGDRVTVKRLGSGGEIAAEPRSWVCAIFSAAYEISAAFFQLSALSRRI